MNICVDQRQPNPGVRLKAGETITYGFTNTLHCSLQTSLRTALHILFHTALQTVLHTTLYSVHFHAVFIQHCTIL